MSSIPGSPVSAFLAVVLFRGLWLRVPLSWRAGPAPLAQRAETYMCRCSSPFLLLWSPQQEHSSQRHSCLARIMGTMTAGEGSLASVGLSTEAVSFPPLKPHPSVVQPHPNGSPDWWNLNSWRPEEALDDKRVGRWASGAVGALGEGLERARDRERRYWGYLFSNGDGFYISTPLLLS